MADDKIVIEFDGDIKALKAKLSSTTKQLTRLQKVGGGIDKAITKSAGVAAVAIAGIAAGIGAAVNEASKIEDITTQFEVLTGSTKQAKKSIKELQEFSANTPFQFEGIAQASKQLIAFGFEADELVPKLNSIGDVASATGNSLTEISTIFGQVAAAGKLTGERLLQFQERAIPIGPAIAKTLGVAEESVKDLVSKGAVDFKTFEKAFQSLSEEGGFAFGGMIKQSKTLSGVLSTTKDNLSLMAAELGEELLPAAKNIAAAFLTFLKTMRETDNFISVAVKSWGPSLASAFDQSAKAAEKDLGTIQKELEQVDDDVKRVEASIAAGKDQQIYNSFIGKANQDMQEYGDLLARKSELEAEQVKANKTLQDRKAAEDTERKALEIEEQKEADKAALEAKLESMTEAEVALEEARIAAQNREAELLSSHEKNKEKIAVDSLHNIAEAKRKVELEDLKATTKENDLRLKEEIRFGKNLAAAKAFFRSEEFKGTQTLLSNLASLSASGNKTLGRIAKAASISRAVMNTAQGVTNALANIPAPLNFAVAASAAAAGAVQIATIKNQKFADGGMFTGGLTGIDSIPATLQQGEVVVPKKNFEEVIGSTRAQRAAEDITGTADNGPTEILLSFKDDVGDFIEAIVLERRVTGVGAI